MERLDKTPVINNRLPAKNPARFSIFISKFKVNFLILARALMRPSRRGGVGSRRDSLPKKWF
jgi:hypothetical protein